MNATPYYFTSWRVFSAAPDLVSVIRGSFFKTYPSDVEPQRDKQRACTVLDKNPTAGRLERRFASWNRLRIVWSLMFTLLVVRSFVHSASAVAVLSLSDVRTTKRSCCLVIARGRRWFCSELKQFARAVKWNMLGVNRAEYLWKKKKAQCLLQQLTRTISSQAPNIVYF